MNENLILLEGHALIEHKLGQMRHKDCPPELFRRYVREIGMMLGTIAADTLQTHATEISTPLETTQGKRLKNHPVIVPILRAGLGLAEGVAAIISEADTGHIGLKRNETTLEPETYYLNLPELKGRDILLTDVMLATGGSTIRAIALLLENGASLENIQVISVLAAPEGIKAVQLAYPSIRMVVAALDRELNEKGYICPGLGDAGDRMFGTS